jgi:hypothetical protein
VEGRKRSQGVVLSATPFSNSTTTVIASQRVGAFAPPDDRLREAIHGAAKQEDGLLRRFRFRLRSVSYGGQASQ